MPVHHSYAFFDYSEELHSYCIEHLHDKSAYLGSEVSDPNMIRISVYDLTYTTCRAVSMARQRPRLTNEDFYTLMILPTETARMYYIDDRYAEYAQQGLM